MQLDDRELIARTLQAEAGNQGLGGMLAVGSVIKNRMGSGQSFRDIILAPAQFSAWNKFTGAAGGEQGQDMSKIKPSEDAYAAADALISGNIADITGGATHYYNPDISNPAWGASAGGDWTKIGSHVFGKAGDFRTGAKDMIGAQAPQQMAQQEQPRGLLGGMIDRDFADQLYMAALAGSPNAQRFQPLIQQVAAGQKERRLQKGRNATADYLDRIGQADLANLLRQGGIDAKTALSAGTQASKDTADIREYNLAVSQGYKGTFENWQQAGKKSTEFGTIPSGYQLVEGTDDQGRPTYQMVPVKGSPDYIKEQERLKQQELAKTGKIGTNLSFYSAGERVINSIDNDPTLIPKTGVLAGLVRDTVFGQKQKNVAEDLAIMEAQMQFETLAQLKAQSPSGASGLGQLTDSERRALGKVKYNFDALQGEDAIKRNIRSAMMFRSYFENGLLDPETNTYRNATEEELDMMTQGINPFTQKGGPRLVGVGRYLGENPKVQVIGTVTIEEVTE